MHRVAGKMTISTEQLATAHPLEAFAVDVEVEVWLLQNRGVWLALTRGLDRGALKSIRLAGSMTTSQ